MKNADVQAEGRAAAEYEAAAPASLLNSHCLRMQSVKNADVQAEGRAAAECEAAAPASLLNSHCLRMQSVKNADVHSPSLARRRRSRRVLHLHGAPALGAAGAGRAAQLAARLPFEIAKRLSANQRGRAGEKNADVQAEGRAAAEYEAAAPASLLNSHCLRMQSVKNADVQAEGRAAAEYEAAAPASLLNSHCSRMQSVKNADVQAEGRAAAEFEAAAPASLLNSHCSRMQSVKNADVHSPGLARRRRSARSNLGIGGQGRLTSAEFAAVGARLERPLWWWLDQ